MLVCPSLVNAQGESKVLPPDPIAQRIYDEGMHHSLVKPLAQVLMDSIGPRLLGSPANRAANDWLVRTYTAWGIPARNEKYGTWRSWTRGLSRVELLAPRTRSLEATMVGWSPATPPGGVTGEVVALPPVSETHDSAGFARWLTTVRGKFVLTSVPQPTCRPDTSWASAALPAEYSAMRAGRDSAAQEWQSRRQVAGKMTQPFREVLASAGVVGMLTSNWSNGWGVDKIFSTESRTMPVFDVSCEDYSMLARLAENHQHPRVHAVAESQMDAAEAPVYNTVAELKGSEHPDQYVMLSAHLDSWDSGSGATDNGTGTIVALEAMRLLKKFYPHPKRTILVGHWSGEEEGDFGSGAFVVDHPEIQKGLQALFNQDNGTGRIDYIMTQGFLQAPATLKRWMSQMPADLTAGIRLVDSAGSESTDNDSFVCHDLPAFTLTSFPWDYDDYTWHTNRDTFDKISFDEVERNATLVALFAYLASEDPVRLSSERRADTRHVPQCDPVQRTWAGQH